MIDHLCITVANFRRSRAWYQAALAPLGYELKYDGEHGAGLAAGFGPQAEEQAVLYLLSSAPGRGQCEPLTHFCLRADSQATVQAFHAAALQAGGEDNGQPGLRKEYGYYAAFVLDPDGYNVEVACYV
ncbi:VOC family protein [Pseudomonas sp. EggHat1]|uniref:VOC family protein n=1 Tax=Pseudomonas sp. EggHat1 TaxID=2761624 RepID=UPI00186961C2|nr:VOC family protein [Pseudomonas sp. EggHat1]